MYYMYILYISNTYMYLYNITCIYIHIYICVQLIRSTSSSYYVQFRYRNIRCYPFTSFSPASSESEYDINLIITRGMK